MIPPTIPELVDRASQLPYLREHLALAPGGDTAIASLPGLTLESVYEPIYDVTMPGAPQSSSFADAIERYGDELGFQAVLRASGAPYDPFDAIADDPTLVAVDRLSRALHAINFFGPQRHGLLFLRVHERLLKSVKYDHGKHFSTVLRSFGLSPERIVIELPAAAVAHKTFLGYLTRSYQHHGFKVADKLPDPGRILAVESDMARPDYIKMDAAIALRDGMVKALVGYAQRVRIPIIFDHVIDEAQFLLLRQYDVRLMQGPAFTQPAPV
ncbi:EAL domain-containing protein [Burkholderia glumae]|uniref:EAL domain-containing protein n=1 Tax=Burkholderia glumae TaxID=337 RepID=A0AAQ0BVP1_BURGL|nr:EAL domain-containing protein [Burkholderia glumae]ACR27884.1 EAL domain-containing protein [Burkholderia glumae BGR1]AJY66283.1 EAL domain protein [Burkholderia glumae LMG 2196 = ATCC 33617]KHJ61262.1 diguanylate phosphodiesterase [Burkholderia glumae]MCM2481138.1 EAL domain-containing protein [Burkholderia glumae]MCM2492183.1 EAL domain-containing protein [Burkholderia glumae]